MRFTHVTISIPQQNPRELKLNKHISQRQYLPNQIQRIGITWKHWINSNPSYGNEDNEKLTTPGKLVRSYLQFIHFCTKYELSRLVEYVPSNGICDIFKFHDHLFTRFSLAGCLRTVVRTCTGPKRVNWA